MEGRPTKRIKLKGRHDGLACGTQPCNGQVHLHSIFTFRCGGLAWLLEQGLHKVDNASQDNNGRALDEQSLRAELDNRRLLSSLYDNQLAGLSDIAATSGHPSCCFAAPCTASDVKSKAMRNYERSVVLASYLREYDTFLSCSIALAGLHISDRDLQSAAAVFDACIAECCRVVDARVRNAMLVRVLPMSMEVCNMQGRCADSYVRWRLLAGVWAQAGRCAPQDCPICGEPFAPDRACLALGCGHSFHRDCCDAWLGRQMRATGSFCAECPVCKQLDSSLHPTPAAMQAMEECRRAGELGSAGSSSSGEGATSSSESGSSSRGSSYCSSSSGSVSFGDGGQADDDISSGSEGADDSEDTSGSEDEGGSEEDCSGSEDSEGMTGSEEESNSESQGGGYSEGSVSGGVCGISRGAKSGDTDGGSQEASV